MTPAVADKFTLPRDTDLEPGKTCGSGKVVEVGTGNSVDVVVVGDGIVEATAWRPADRFDVVA